MSAFNLKTIIVLILGTALFLNSQAQSIKVQAISSTFMNFNQTTNGHISCAVGDVVNINGRDQNNNTLNMGYIPCIISIFKEIYTPQSNVGISVFPNPTRDMISILVDSPEDFIQIEITDTHGKQLVSEKHNNISDKISINMLNFSAGTYLLLFKDVNGNYISNYKIIKQ
jgi:hypothetical protein